MPREKKKLSPKHTGKKYREHKAKAGRHSKLGGKTGASLLRERRQSDTGETH